jgi:hypothetical protein
LVHRAKLGETLLHDARCEASARRFCVTLCPKLLRDNLRDNLRDDLRDAA